MIYVITLAHASIKLCEESIGRFFGLTQMPREEVQRILVSCGYPLPTRQVHYSEMGRLARDFYMEHWIFLKNLGVAGNYNQVIERLNHNTRHYTSSEGQQLTSVSSLQDDDMVAFYDPDSWPMSRDWLCAMRDVMQATGAPYVSLGRKTEDASQDSPVEEIAGRRAQKITRACGWPMGAYSGKFFKAAYPLDQKTGPHHHPFYGYFEDFILEKINELSPTAPAYILTDIRDQGYEHPPVQASVDKSYHEWKCASARRETAESFEKWLASRG